MMVTRAIAPTSRRRARFLSWSSSSLIDLAISVRNLCLTRAFDHDRGDRKKGSENKDFIIISGRFTGGSPCRCDVAELNHGRPHPGVCQLRPEFFGARTAPAAGR